MKIRWNGRRVAEGAGSLGVGGVLGLAGLVVVLMFGGSGCGSSEASESLSDRADFALVATLEDRGVVLTDEETQEYTQIVCDGLEREVPAEWLVMAQADRMPQYTIEDHAFIAGAIAGAHCSHLWVW